MSHLVRLFFLIEIQNALHILSYRSLSQSNAISFHLMEHPNNNNNDYDDYDDDGDANGGGLLFCREIIIYYT